MKLASRHILFTKTNKTVATLWYCLFTVKGSGSNAIIINKELVTAMAEKSNLSPPTNKSNMFLAELVSSSVLLA